MVYESNEINLIKLQDGTNGKPGKDGSNGKTLYTWVKYSQYADGTDLTDDPTDAVYIGIAYNKEDKIESDIKTDYTWSKIKGEDGYTPVKGVDYFDGADGTSSYMWIRYATDSSGSNMTDTPSESTTYIGTATTTSATAPSSANDYKWSKYVGSDGIPGKKGDDGKTAYLHIAYANSADGKTGFDISNGTGKLYIGQYTDNTSTDSTDPTKYTWTKIKGEDGTSVTIKSTSITYQASSSGITTPTGTWSTSVPTVSNGQYLWTKTVVTYSDGKSTTAYSVAYKGTDGENGISSYTHIRYSANADGSNFVETPSTETEYIGVYTGKSSTTSEYKWSKYVGDKGAPGAAGNGINSITYYYATTTTQTAPSASSITSTSIPILSATNKYLWQKEVIDYTDSSVADKTSVILLAVYGDTGATGVGISSVDVWYVQSDSSITAPTSGWETTAPTWVDGKYIWTKTVTTFTNNTTKESTPICITGSTGLTGKGIASITEEYYLSTSKTEQPEDSDSWTTTPPIWTSGKYVWTRSKIVYTDNTTACTTPICDSSWEAVNEVQVGGRNYFSSKNQAAFDENNEYTLPAYQNTGSFRAFYNLTLPMSYFVGKNCKLSFDAISPNGDTKLSIYNTNGNPRYVINGNVIPTISTTWAHQELTITVTDRGEGETYSESASNKIEFYFPSQTGCKIRNVKFEIGNKATDWTPAPEDVDSNISDLEIKFNSSIKANNEALESKMEKIYYTKGEADELATSVSTLKQTAENIEINFSNTINDIEGVANESKERLGEISSYIRFDKDGMILGKSDSPLILKQENDCISFIQNNSKVAYFSNDKLYVTYGEFLNSIKIGNFAFIPRENGNLSFKKIT